MELKITGLLTLPSYFAAIWQQCGLSFYLNSTVHRVQRKNV